MGVRDIVLPLPLPLPLPLLLLPLLLKLCDDEGIERTVVVVVDKAVVADPLYMTWAASRNYLQAIEGHLTDNRRAINRQLKSIQQAIEGHLTGN